MSDDSKQLAKAVEVQYQHDTRDLVTEKVIDEIKASVVFQYNWEELLQSAPVALTCMGNCFIASTSNTGQSLKLVPPRDGFKFLQNSALNANLVDCVNLGTLAFYKAEKNMGYIKDSSKKISNRVADVMEALMDPPTARTQLKPYLENIRVGADDCYQRAKEVDQEFEKWLNHAMELHAACVQTQSTTEEQVYATQLNMAVARTRFTSAEEGVKSAKAAQDTFSQQLQVASDAYKQASDKFPSGWDILGQQVVGALAETVTTALGQLVGAYASNLNPVAQAQSGASMFSDLIHGGKNAKPDGSAPPVPPAPQAPKSAVPPHSTDQAYAAIVKDIVWLELINKVLTKGKEGGVDWDMAAGTDGASDKSVYVALALLKEALSAFQKLSTGEEPSRSLLSVLETAVDVASKIQAEVDKSQDTAHKYPAATSDIVKGWQKSFTEAYTTANRLAAVARTLPGTAAGGAPVMAPPEDPAVTIARTNAKSAQAQAVLEAAKNRLATTQQHLQATQQLYSDASKNLLEQQAKLGEIDAEITRLGKTKLGLEEIKAILVKCIELMVQMKQQIMNLCRFFAAVSGAIEAIAKYAVTPFIEQIKAATSGDNGKTLGNYTLTDLTRTFIYQGAITVRAYFSIFGDIAQMWVTLSKENIMPGLHLIDEMMLEPDDVDKAQQKAAKLQAWGKKAQAAIKELSMNQQKAILGDMQARIDSIQDATRELPPSPVAQKAIEAGSSEVLNIAKESLSANSATAPYKGFGIRRV